METADSATGLLFLVFFSLLIDFLTFSGACSGVFEHINHLAVLFVGTYQLELVASRTMATPILIVIIDLIEDVRLDEEFVAIESLLLIGSEFFVAFGNLLIRVGDLSIRIGAYQRNLGLQRWMVECQVKDLFITS